MLFQLDGSVQHLASRAFLGNDVPHEFSIVSALYVKIFYVDSEQNNTFYEDSKRGGELENLLINLSTVLLKDNIYSFNVNSRETYTAKVDEIHQHYAILKMNFKVLIQ